MSKFKPGDPVWARAIPLPKSYFKPWQREIPPGEYAGNIVTIDRISDAGFPVYHVSIQLGLSECGESYLRPRRDDYQQHEGKGDRSLLDKPLKDDPLPVIKRREFI